MIQVAPACRLEPHGEVRELCCAPVEIHTSSYETQVRKSLREFALRRLAQFCPEWTECQAHAVPFYLLECTPVEQPVDGTGFELTKSGKPPALPGRLSKV
jgi:hypothetical protein